jgi:hypothetical protein
VRPRPLILTHTHPGAYDNGYPFPSLAPFVAAWNRMALTPALRLTTATDSVMRMEREIGGAIATLEGEWTDWWANGTASGPREVAASRVAKRALAAAVSPAFGPMPPKAATTMTAIVRDLCLFDEHTWGASNSISVPYGLGTLAQYVEKSELAYRPMGMADALLHRRMRASLDGFPEGRLRLMRPCRDQRWASIKGIDPKALSWQASGLARPQRSSGRAAKPAAGSKDCHRLCKRLSAQTTASGAPADRRSSAEIQ